MAKAAISDVEGLRRYLRQKAPFLGDLNPEQRKDGIESLDQLLNGGLPKGGVTVLTGTGRMTLAARFLAHLTDQSQPVAWVDGRQTVYPPALLQMGIKLERLLMVRGRSDRIGYATEQLIESGAFSAVVASGLEKLLTPTRARRIQTATEGANVSTILLLEPAAAAQVTNASLKLRLSRRPEALMVEVLKDKAGRAGRRCVLSLCKGPQEPHAPEALHTSHPKSMHQPMTG